MNIRCMSILPFLLLAFSAVNSPAVKEPQGMAIKAERYYTLEDYKSVKKFDTHIHINTNETVFMELAKADNFRFLDIVDDQPFGLPMAEQQKHAFLPLKNFPELMTVATTFSVKDWDSKDWAETTIAALKRDIANGASAVKIWKNIGMDLKDKNGRFVMVNHPRLYPVLNYLAKNNIPLIGHNGEPRDCWLPLDKMIFSWRIIDCLRNGLPLIRTYMMQPHGVRCSH